MVSDGVWIWIFLSSQPHFLCFAPALEAHFHFVEVMWSHRLRAIREWEYHDAGKERSGPRASDGQWSWAMSGFLYFFFFCVMLRHVTHVSFWHIREHTPKIPEVSWSDLSLQETWYDPDYDEICTLEKLPKDRLWRSQFSGPIHSSPIICPIELGSPNDPNGPNHECCYMLLLFNM